MTENRKDMTVPAAMAELEWVWVLASPLSQNRDSFLVIDMDEKEGRQRRRVIPVFETRESAARLKPQITGQGNRNYSEHTIRLSEVGAFAAKHGVEIMLLDENGTIMAHMEARLEQVSIH